MLLLVCGKWDDNDEKRTEFFMMVMVMMEGFGQSFISSSRALSFSVERECRRKDCG